MAHEHGFDFNRIKPQRGSEFGELAIERAMIEKVQFHFVLVYLQYQDWPSLWLHFSSMASGIVLPIFFFLVKQFDFSGCIGLLLLCY